jgi:hypothetical protein
MEKEKNMKRKEANLIDFQTKYYEEQNRYKIFD